MGAGGLASAEQAAGQRRRKGWLIVASLAAAVLVVGGVGLYVWLRVDPLGYDTYWIPSPAMEPTYEQGSTIRTKDVDGTDVERGDVIVFHEETAATEVDLLVKRVVAVGGDEVAPGPGGTVLVNGEPLATTDLEVQRWVRASS